MVNAIAPAWECIFSVIPETSPMRGKRVFLTRSSIIRENAAAMTAVMMTTFVCI